MAKLSLGFCGAVALLLAGGLPARADVITLAVSATGFAFPCSSTCTLSGEIVINNSSGAANSGFVSADVTTNFSVAGFPDVGPFTSLGVLGVRAVGTTETELSLDDPTSNVLNLVFTTPSAGSNIQLLSHQAFRGCSREKQLFASRI
jgi:hypothetical protein